MVSLKPVIVFVLPCAISKLHSGNGGQRSFSGEGNGGGKEDRVRCSCG